MKALLRWLGRGLLVLVLGGFALWILGPYEEASLETSFDANVLEGGVDAYFKQSEARFDDITPGVEKQVIWANAAEERTSWAVLYLHGFSASSQEIRPVPDLVAEGLGANLVFTRLQGHGRDGDAMAEATVSGWMEDVAEALAVARNVGERVLVISTSTGGTLAAAAAQDDELSRGIAGVVFISPNFGVNNPAAPLLSWPAARYWLPVLVGQQRSFEPANEGQATYWTTEYPSVAVFPMAALVKKVVSLDHRRATQPALFWFSDADQVVVAAETRKVAAAWGGPARIVNPDLSAGADASSHVIAGDILSPAQTSLTVDSILDWAKDL